MPPGHACKVPHKRAGVLLSSGTASMNVRQARHLWTFVYARDLLHSHLKSPPIWTPHVSAPVFHRKRVIPACGITFLRTTFAVNEFEMAVAASSRPTDNQKRAAQEQWNPQKIHKCSGFRLVFGKNVYMHLVYTQIFHQSPGLYLYWLTWPPRHSGWVLPLWITMPLWWNKEPGVEKGGVLNYGMSGCRVCDSERWKAKELATCASQQGSRPRWMRETNATGVYKSLNGLQKNGGKGCIFSPIKCTAVFKSQM